MRKILSTIILAAFAGMMIGCSFSKSKGSKGKGAEAEQMTVTEESMEYTELTKVPLPCPKEDLYTAWKQIGVVELQRKKSLDYKQHTPVLFISADLDEDGNPEVLLRGEPPYAAIYSFVKDSLHLITFADRAELGLAITPDGTIIRNGIGSNSSSISEFIRLENSKIAASGAIRETFVIKDGAMTSGGTKYMLQTDSALVEVSKDEYLQVAPQQVGTYLDEIEGWEDFRKP
ncbi:MAG: hypothetical protein J6Y59_02175 [Bacteroidaceae bacterium]|nr:hypothetical protein [Bacteroidaceae bacterium]